MLHERVAEALHDIVAEFLQLFLREVQRGKQFVEHHLLDKGTHDGVLAALFHRIQAAQVADRAQHGVRAVQQGHLALMVRGLGRNEEHVQAGFVGRELGSDFLRSLNHPQVEDFSLVQQVVLVAHALAQLGGIIARITRDDAVHQRAVHAAGGLEPFRETFSQFPQVDVLADAFLQVLAVFEDQLAREEDHALGRIALEELVPMVQELGQFAGIGRSGGILELAGRIEGDTRLGGVGDDETHLRLLGQLHISLEISIGIDTPADNIDQVHAVHRLAVQESLEVQMIQAVLLVQHVDHTTVDGLDHYDGSVKVRLLVGFPDNPLDESPQEVAFAELDDLLGILFRLRCSRTIQSFHIGCKYTLKFVIKL